MACFVVQHLAHLTHSDTRSSVPPDYPAKCIAMFVNFLYFFEHISPYEHFLAQREVVDTGSPSGHTGRGPGASRALWSAWQALKVFVRGSGKDDFPGFGTIGSISYVRAGKMLSVFCPRLS